MARCCITWMSFGEKPSRRCLKVLIFQILHDSNKLIPREVWYLDILSSYIVLSTNSRFALAQAGEGAFGSFGL